jgi:hypothetical protein
MFFESRIWCKLRQHADRRLAKGPHPRGDVIDHLVQRVILLLNQLMQVMELRPDHIPMVIACFGLQHLLIG